MICNYIRTRCHCTTYIMMDENKTINESGIISLSDKQWEVARRRAEIISAIVEYDHVSISVAK